VNRWQHFRRLSHSERWLLFQAVFLLPLTAWGVRLLGLTRWQALLARLAPVGEAPVGCSPADRVGQARGISRLVEAAARHGPCRAPCLPRSLVLWWVLRRQGIRGDLRVGVRRVEGQLEAHAWVEYLGLALNDRDDVRQRFAAFDRTIGPTGVRSA
jgi:hypothetical protein